MAKTLKKFYQKKEINEEALKHADDYANHMTTVMKRAYFDGFMRGHKQALKSLTKPSTLEKLNQIEIKPTDTTENIKKIVTRKVRKDTKENKILKYLKKHEEGCVHQFMRILKTKNKINATAVLTALKKKGLVVPTDKPSKKCRTCQTKHKRYKLAMKLKKTFIGSVGEKVR